MKKQRDEQMASEEEVPIDLQQAYPGAPFTRRWAFDQALISSRISGFKPDAEYMVVREEVIMGRMSADEAVAYFIEEAQAEERCAYGNNLTTRLQ